MPKSEFQSPQSQTRQASWDKACRELLSRDQIEAEYGITRRWLELAALSGDGPPMIKISRRMVRYQRGVLEAWLTARTVVSTSDASAAQ